MMMMIIIIIIQFRRFALLQYVLSLDTFCNFRRFVHIPCPCQYVHMDIRTCWRDAGCEYMDIRTCWRDAGCEYMDIRTCWRDAGCEYIGLKILTRNVHNEKNTGNSQVFLYVYSL